MKPTHKKTLGVLLVFICLGFGFHSLSKSRTVESLPLDVASKVDPEFLMPTSENTKNSTNGVNIDFSMLRETLRSLTRTRPTTNIVTKSDPLLKITTDENLELYEEVILAVTPEFRETQVSLAIEECFLSLSERTGIDPWLDESIPQHEWWLELAIVSRGTDAYVESAVLADSQTWPSVFDEEMKSCYSNAFVGVTFDSDKKYNYRVTYPVRLIHKSEKKKKRQVATAGVNQ
jgi:hypothetical protein